MVCSTVGVHVMAEKDSATTHNRMFQEALEHLQEDMQQLAAQVKKVEGHQAGRIVAVEQSQKTVLSSARKSLEVAVKVQRRQEQWEARQEDSENSKLRIFGTSASSKTSSPLPVGGWCAQQQTRGCWCPELDLKVSEQERQLTRLEGEIAALRSAVGVERSALVPASPRSRPNEHESRAGLLQSLEARFQSGLNDAARRLDALQAQMDGASAPLLKISIAMPEMLSRVDMIMMQCQGHATKLGRQEVRLNTLSGQMESQPALCLANGHIPHAAGVSGPASDASGMDDGELAGRVDAHSVAISEIFEQLQSHSETLGVSRSSSRSSLHRNAQAPNYLQQTSPSGSRSSSRGAVQRRHHDGPPPQILSATARSGLRASAQLRH